MSNNNNPTYKDLEVVPNEYNKRDYIIKVSIPELTAFAHEQVFLTLDVLI